MTSPFPTLNQHLVNPEHREQRKTNVIFSASPPCKPHTMKCYSQQISYVTEKSRWGTVSNNTIADNQGSQLLRAVCLKNAFLTPTSFISESEIRLSFQTYLKHILKAALNRNLGTCETWRCIWGFNSQGILMQKREILINTAQWLKLKVLEY